MTLDLKKAEMLIDKKDVIESKEGDKTIYRYEPTNTTIEFTWEGVRKGSGSSIQVVQYDDDGNIDEVFDFDNDEKGYWEAVDKFQELIERETNQVPPPPPPCNEQEEENKLREQLKERGLSESQIEATVEAMRPFCNEGTPPPPKEKIDCKPEIVESLTGVKLQDIKTSFRNIRNLLGTLTTIAEEEFIKLGVNKMEFLELVAKCEPLYFEDLEETQDGDGQDGDGQDEDGQDGDGQDGDGQDGDGQDGDGQDGDGQDGDGQDGDGQDGDGQDGDGQDGDDGQDGGDGQDGDGQDGQDGGDGDGGDGDGGDGENGGDGDGGDGDGGDGDGGDGDDGGDDDGGDDDGGDDDGGDDDGGDDDDDDDDKEPLDLTLLEKLVDMPLSQIPINFRSLRNLIGTLKSLPSEEFERFGANKNTFITQLQTQGQTLFQ